MHWQRVRPHSLSCLNSQRYTSVWIQPMWAHASACLCLCTVSIILQNQAECVRVYVQYSDIMQTSHSALFFIILLASRPLIWCRFTIIQSNHGRTFNLGFTALASFSYSSWTVIESCYCPCAFVCVYTQERDEGQIEAAGRACSSCFFERVREQTSQAQVQDPWETNHFNPLNFEIEMSARVSLWRIFKYFVSLKSAQPKLSFKKTKTNLMFFIKYKCRNKQNIS